MSGGVVDRHSIERREEEKKTNALVRGLYHIYQLMKIFRDDKFLLSGQKK